MLIFGDAELCALGPPETRQPLIAVAVIEGNLEAVSRTSRSSTGRATMRRDTVSTRAEALASRVEQGVQALAAYAEGLSDREWRTVCDDGRTVGVLVHHVASQLICETEVLKQMATGKAFSGVSWAMVDEGNAAHARDHAGRSQQEAAELLRRNGALAAEAIRALRDEQLDLATPNSLHADAPVTTQFWIETHPLAHAYHHLASIRTALSAQ